MIKITVNGIPAPQGSKRAYKTKTGKINMVESSKAVGPWREAVRGEVQRAAVAPITGPVEVIMIFRLTRPKGHYRTGRNAHLLRDSAPRYPAVQPDRDKLERATNDGLKMGGAFLDDAQIVHVDSWKIYASPPGADIEIRGLE